MPLNVSYTLYRRPGMRSASFLLLLVLIVAALSQPSLSAQATPSQVNGIIQGWVRDAATQTAIPFATIKIDKLVVSTDERGIIPVTAVPLAAPIIAVDIEVTAPGYGVWRYADIELSDEHPVELHVTLTDKPQLFEVSPPVAAAAAPFDGPPDYISVGRTFSTTCVYPPTNVQRVDRVPFIDYVRNVLPNEWALSWKDRPAALEAGAVAAGQFAWSTAFVQRKWTNRGYTFDVLDSVCDQVYKDRNPKIDYSPTDNAVAKMWGVALIRDNKLITTFFRDTDTSCEERAKTPDCMGQWGSYYRAQEGLSALEILHYYYDPVTDIRTAPANRGLVITKSPDIAVWPGRANTLSVCMRNIGATAWLQGSTNLVALDPDNPQNTAYTSPLVNNTWYSSQQPATLAHTSAALGRNGSWKFSVTAPPNLAPGKYQILVQPRHSSGITVPTDVPIIWNVTVVDVAKIPSHRTLIPMLSGATGRPDC